MYNLNCILLFKKKSNLNSPFFWITIRQSLNSLFKWYRKVFDPLMEDHLPMNSVPDDHVVTHTHAQQTRQYK